MCERNKTEVLARELCLEFCAGKKAEDGIDVHNVKPFVEKHWTKWEKRAGRILRTLENHND